MSNLSGDNHSDDVDTDQAATVRVNMRQGHDALLGSNTSIEAHPETTG